MTRQQFFKLPATRKGIEILEKEFIATGDVFYNMVSRELRTHLQLPTSAKKVVGKFCFENHYNKIIEIQKLGYAKTTILPF